MHYTIETTATFLEWFDKLKDNKVKTKILARFVRIENGNFGDHKQLSSNLFELRFFSVVALEYIIRSEIVS